MKFIKVILDERDKENLLTVGFVDRFNKLPLYCKIHPDQETVLLVSSAPSKEGFVRVQSICCEDFRNQLIQQKLIAPENQNQK